MRMRGYCLIVSLLLCLIPCRAESQAVSRRSFILYDNSEGLPSNRVKRIAQDKEGYIWAATNDGLCRFDGKKFSVPSFVNSLSGFNQNINDLVIDNDNVLWASNDESLLYIDLNTKECGVARNGYHPTHMEKDSKGNIWCISDNVLSRYSSGTWTTFGGIKAQSVCSSPGGRVWAISTDEVLYLLDNSETNFTEIPLGYDSGSGSGLSRISCLDERELLVITKDNSALLFDSGNGQLKKLFDGKIDGRGAIAMDITSVGQDEFWLATDNGLFSLNREGKISRVSYVFPDGQTLPSNLRCVFKDNLGRIWVGTFFEGVFCCFPGSITYYIGAADIPGTTLKGSVVRSMCEDPYGNCWAATEDGTLEKICPDGSIRSWGEADGFPHNANFQATCISGNSLLIGSYGFGLYRMDLASEKISGHYDIGSDMCICILGEEDGEVYVGTTKGLYRMDSEGAVRKIESISSGFLHALCQDSRGYVWAGMYRGGLFRYSPLRNEAIRIRPDSPDIDFESLRVTSIKESSDGNIWVATEGNGVFVLSPDQNIKGTFATRHIGKSDGLPSNIACSVTEDESGNMWIATLGGVVMMDHNLNVLKVSEFDVKLSQFRYGSVLNTTTGRIAFGSTKGIISFIPSQMAVLNRSLKISDVYGTDGKTLIDEVENGTIDVRYADASITIELATFEENLDEVLQYRYSLDSRHGNRHRSKISNDNQITFVDLAPGKYTFTASIVGDDSSGASVSRRLVVRHPWYSSTTAIVLYLLLFLCGLFFYVEHQRLKFRRESSRKAEMLEMEKQQDVYESKLEFFTDISHEIRTPLTLIKIPVDKIIGQHLYKEEAEDDMKIVKSNTERLLDLVNKALDLRKYDGERKELSFSEADIASLMRESCEEFSKVGKEVGVEFSCDIPAVPVMASCSKISIEKIVRNLLMNGVKYCKSKVDVKMTTDEENVIVTVDSDGQLIAASEREKIFEPFYQSKTRLSNISSAKGTGIGLALSKFLAKLHGGDVILDADRTDCNSFVFTLPKKQRSSQEAEAPTFSTTEENAREIDASGKFTVLIVEDDRVLNNLLAKELSDEYNVLQASNGKVAVDILSKHQIGLIISDIVMPEMDGCQLCNYVKDTVDYSHIPVILMTAVADSENELSSLKSGADYYLSKPFSMSVLKASIFNIVKNREIITKQFSSKPFNMEVASSGVKDEAFMEKLFSTVMDNISNPEFSVVDLADQLFVSRSTLFRKVKANTGQNVNEYIKICRLKKASELLASNKYMIKEISYMVGFTSASYFAKEFQKQFGISPSSLVSSGKAEE